MNITYYNKVDDNQMIIANFGVYMPERKQIINNLSILKSKQGGWFIAMPTYKNKKTDAWEKVTEFDKELQYQFMKAARVAVEAYAKEHKEVIA